MPTVRTISDRGFRVGEPPEDGRSRLRRTGGLARVRDMHHLGAPRAGTGARGAPVPYAPPEPSRSRLARWFDNWMRSDRKSTRLNSSHSQISYAVFCLKKKKKNNR